MIAVAAERSLGFERANTTAEKRERSQPPPRTSVEKEKDKKIERERKKKRFKFVSGQRRTLDRGYDASPRETESRRNRNADRVG